MTNNQMGKTSGVLGTLLTSEIYVQEFVLHVTFHNTYLIFTVQSLVAIVFGVIAAELHSRIWYVAVAISVITLAFLVMSLAA
jgi:hypothetical protein